MYCPSVLLYQAMIEASKTENVPILEWLSARHEGVVWLPHIVDAAASMGQLEMLKRLCSHPKIAWCFPLRILPLAARGGHLDTVKWIHEQGHDSMTPPLNAVLDAIRSGHSDVAKYLFEHSMPDEPSPSRIDRCRTLCYFHVSTMEPPCSMHSVCEMAPSSSASLRYFITSFCFFSSSSCVRFSLTRRLKLLCCCPCDSDSLDLSLAGSSLLAVSTRCACRSGGTNESSLPGFSDVLSTICCTAAAEAKATLGLAVTTAGAGAIVICAGLALTDAAGT